MANDITETVIDGNDAVKHAETNAVDEIRQVGATDAVSDAANKAATDQSTRYEKDLPDESVDTFLLPRSIIKRIAKDALGQPYQIQADALTALSRCSVVALNYIVNAANEIAISKKRKVVSAQDVIDAMPEIEFESLVPVLKHTLTEIEGEKLANKQAQEHVEKQINEEVNEHVDDHVDEHVTEQIEKQAEKQANEQDDQQLSDHIELKKPRLDFDEAKAGKQNGTVVANQQIVDKDHEFEEDEEINDHIDTEGDDGEDIEDDEEENAVDRIDNNQFSDRLSDSEKDVGDISDGNSINEGSSSDNN